MFLHKHPYPPFIPKNATKLIIGTLPPPRFSFGQLKPDDVNFCYGSRDGQLWKILDTIFKLNLQYDNSDGAIKQRKDFLTSRGIGICDIVESAQRQKIDASDLGMQNAKLRDLISYLKRFPKIDTLLFTGGNSKNGPEYFFRKHLKAYNLKLEIVSKEVPRIHQFKLPVIASGQTDLVEVNAKQSNNDEVPNRVRDDKRVVKTISLTAPSGSANRAVGSMDLYKQLKAKNPNFTTLDFRMMQYRPYFT